MDTNIPDTQWQPLSIADVTQLFTHAPFLWGVAGGYAVELFLGITIRDHSDTDILVCRDEQLRAQHWLSDWQLFASDPPGTLRPWRAGEYLPYGIHDIWGHRCHIESWQLQIMLAEVEGKHWYMRRNPQVRGLRDDLIVSYHGVPCLRIEVQLLFKARSNRAKDTADFQACLPHLTAEAKSWLREQMQQVVPADHPWLNHL
jgi:hypothetical protein